MTSVIIDQTDCYECGRNLREIGRSVTGNGEFLCSTCAKDYAGIVREVKKFHTPDFFDWEEFEHGTFDADTFVREYGGLRGMGLSAFVHSDDRGQDPFNEEVRVTQVYWHLDRSKVRVSGLKEKSWRVEGGRSWKTTEEEQKMAPRDLMEYVADHVFRRGQFRCNGCGELAPIEEQERAGYGGVTCEDCYQPGQKDVPTT